MKTVAKGLLYGIVAVTFFQVLISTGDAGNNPCVTKVKALHDQGYVDSDPEMDWELNYIGCDGTKRASRPNRCERLAYDVARDWIKNGQPILNLTVDKMGRALDHRSIHGGIKRFDCTLEEDLSWSYETGD